MTQFVPAGAMAAFALASGYATLTVYHKQQAITETKTTTVDGLTPGRVNLAGAVEAEETVRSPVTGEEAVVVDWEVRGEQNDPSDQGEPSDRVAGGQRTGEFGLADGTGVVPVRPAVRGRTDCLGR